VTNRDTYPLPIEPNIIGQMAAATIKSLVDAIVELTTNSDDSYRRLEQDGRSHSGQIWIRVTREKGNKCKFLEVADQAEGMDSSGLKNAIRFSGSTSGLTQGKSVRGLFGRGLKEAIVALGNGKIRTVKGGRESIVQIFTQDGQVLCRDEVLARDTTSADGTVISITVTSEKIKCPTFDTLEQQISCHFALRDIIASPSRLVRLKVSDNKGSREKRLHFNTPEGSLRVEKDGYVNGLGRITIKIWESTDPLYVRPSDPTSIAGLLIQTEGTNLDNHFFGFEADEAAHYFFGIVDCPGLTGLLRSNETGILNPNRNGLDWRHSICQQISNEVIPELRKLVSNKRAQLQTATVHSMNPRSREKLKQFCDVLNSLAEQELEELPSWASWATTNSPQIENVVVKPSVAKSEPDVLRAFTIYASQTLCDKYGRICLLSLEEAQGVQLATSSVELRRHTKYPVYCGQFQAKGSNYGDYGYITVELGPAADMAELRIEPIRSSTRKSSLTGASGGPFREISFDHIPNPTQRAALSDGVLRIFVQFPAVKRYLGVAGEGMDTPLGSLMLAELVTEAFCRYVARRRIETGQIPAAAGSEIDAFNNEVNSLMKKYLETIHSFWVSS
jgi:hypothetical protein